MIKINLLDKGGDGIKVPVNLGVDLTKINWIALIISIIVWLSASYTIDSIYNKKSKEVLVHVGKLEKKLKELKVKVNKDKKVINMLVDFEEKREMLKTRTKHVQQILSHKSNPRKILERIARDISKDLWLNKIYVNNRKIEIVGTAFNYHSIGNFIVQANQSKFFGKSLKLSNEQVKTETIELMDGRKINVERFKIDGNIINFE